jgi:hypothetical protein
MRAHNPHHHRLKLIIYVARRLLALCRIRQYKRREHLTFPLALPHLPRFLMPRRCHCLRTSQVPATAVKQEAQPSVFRHSVPPAPPAKLVLLLHSFPSIIAGPLGGSSGLDMTTQVFQSSPASASFGFPVSGAAGSPIHQGLIMRC